MTIETAIGYGLIYGFALIFILWLVQMIRFHSRPKPTKPTEKPRKKPRYEEEDQFIFIDWETEDDEFTEEIDSTHGDEDEFVPM